MRRITFAGLLLASSAALVGCGDSTGLDLAPLLVRDTIQVAEPSLPQNADLPTAIDVTGAELGFIWGGRFPERPADALEWDFLVRIRDGEMVLVPGGALGLDSRASITPAVTGETFEGLREAPAQSTFISDAPVVIREGNVYVARSREGFGLFGFVCGQFAKLTPVEIDLAQGRATIAIVTNGRCGDPRLVLE